MKVENLKPADLVGCWIFHRRLRDGVFSRLARSYVQEIHAGDILGLVGGLAFDEPDYPRRPRERRTPWFEAFDELEIHAVVRAAACGAASGEQAA